MGSFEALLKGAEDAASNLRRLSRESKNILLVAHIDADGVATASILAKALLRRKGRFIVRVVGDLNPQLLRKIGEAAYDFHVLCETGGGLTDEIRKYLGERWLIVDHHQIFSERELKEDIVFNAWRYGFDGGREVCGAGMAYFIAKCMDEENLDMSWLPIVAAVADRQDQGEKRSLIGLNRRIVDEAVSTGRLEVKIDLLLHGRETKPIHEALASTTTPFIPGLTGNSDVCLAALTSAGIKLKDDGRWRTASNLSEEEKMKLVEAVIPHLGFNQSLQEQLEEMIGEVYVLKAEDENTPLRDAREFATLLNACGRTGRAGLGVAICMDNRDEALREGEKALSEYRQILSSYVKTILEEEGRVMDKAGLIIVQGEGLVAEDMLGPLTSVLSSLPIFRKKILLAKTMAATGDTRFSARRLRGCDPSLNIGSIISEAAASCGGYGGGHDAAAGARVPSSKAKDFLSSVASSILK